MLHNGSVTTTKQGRVYKYLHLTWKQAILSVVLIAVITLLSIIWIVRTEYTSDPNVFIWYSGFPFEALKIKNVASKGWYYDVGTILRVVSFYELLWVGMIVNLIIYIVLSIITVKLVTWIHEEIEYRRYYKS